MEQVAVGYIRVSTEDQATEGVSLDAQHARIVTWCEANSYQLIHVHVDAGLSGKRADNRPGLQDALTDACRRKAALVVYSLSRLARSTRDALSISDRLDRAGADLVSLSERIDTTSAAGKMLFRVLAVLAEFERDIIAERTTLAMGHLRRQGKRISGHLPFGYNLAQDGKCLIENDAEQQVLNQIAQWKSEGQSLNAIVRKLNERRVVGKNGGLWTATTVRGIQRRTAAA